MWNAGSTPVTVPAERPLRRLGKVVLACLRRRAEDRRLHRFSAHLLRDIGVSGRELGYDQSTKWYDRR